MRRTLTAAALALAIVGAGSGAAFAADDYTPGSPSEPSLAGSLASGTCSHGEPRIAYDVRLTDPSGVAKSHTAYLQLSGGGQVLDIELGELVDNTLSGSIAWPSESWTHGDITATLHVNPQTAVPLSYPLVANPCGDPAAASSNTLATTGGTISLVAAGIGVAAVAVGAGLTLRRRRRAQR